MIDLIAWFILWVLNGFYEFFELSAVCHFLFVLGSLFLPFVLFVVRDIKGDMEFLFQCVIRYFFNK